MIDIIKAEELLKIMTDTGVYPEPRNEVEKYIFETASSYECEAMMDVTEEKCQEYVDALKASGYHIASYGKDTDPCESDSYFIAFDWMGMPPDDM